MENKLIIAETERLILRRFEKGDLQDLYEYLCDEEVVKYEPYKPMNLEETKENLEWRISTDEMIGNVYIGKREFESLEIGYVFNQNYLGKGYASESCKALIKLTFLNGKHRIYAECDPNNTASWKLLEALDFQREGKLKKMCTFGKMNMENLFGKTHIYSQN